MTQHVRNILKIYRGDDMDKETVLSIIAQQDFYLETLDKLAEVVIEGMDFLDLPKGHSFYELKEDVFVALDKVFEKYLD